MSEQEPRDRDLTATQLLIKVLEDPEIDDVDAIVVCYHTEAGEMIYWKTNASTPMAVGLMQIVKQYIEEGWSSGKDFDSPESEASGDDEEEEAP